MLRKLWQRIMQLLNIVIIVYLLVILYYYIFGGFSISITVVDLEKPYQIFAAAIGLRLLFSLNKITWSRARVFGLLSVIISVLLTLCAGEIFLRIYFKGGGRLISAGPGPERFEKFFPEVDGETGPIIHGPKRPGITRILIQGDSITWGGGVRDWQDVYPHQLLSRLNKNGEKYDMQTYAHPGWEIDRHHKNAKEIVENIYPDIVIYQFYINDLEINKHNRPHSKATIWRSLPFHDYMKMHSYLYFFLDNRLEILLPPFNRTYHQYLLEDYAEGTPGWELFQKEFHQWASITTSNNRRVILMIYPELPPPTKDSLKSLYERIRKICGPNTLVFRPDELRKVVGVNEPDRNSTFGIIRKAYGNATEHNFMIFGPYLNLRAGKYSADFRLKIEGACNNEVATVSAISKKGAVVYFEKTLKCDDFHKSGDWKNFAFPFSVGEQFISDFEFHVKYLGGADFSVDSIGLELDYGIEVVDLEPYLANFNTYSSMFDAHPNARAHHVMADVLYKTLVEKKSVK